MHQASKMPTKTLAHEIPFSRDAEALRSGALSSRDALGDFRSGALSSRDALGDFRSGALSSRDALGDFRSGALSSRDALGDFRSGALFAHARQTITPNPTIPGHIGKL
jgi:hypothetical protein